MDTWIYTYSSGNIHTGIFAVYSTPGNKEITVTRENTSLENATCLKAAEIPDETQISRCSCL